MESMSIRILAILCISTFAAMMGMGILIPILPLYAKSLGASGTMLGIIFSSAAVTFSIFNPIMGRLSDRFGCKYFIFWGLMLRVPVAISYVFATSPFHLIIIRLIEGALGAMVFTAAGAYIGLIAPNNKEGSYMGIFNTSYLLGFGIGPLLGGGLTDLYDKNAPFYVMAGFLLLSSLLVFFLVPNKERSIDGSSGESLLKGKQSLKKMLEYDLMKGLLIVGFILSFVQGALLVFLPIIAEGEMLTPTLIGILTASLLLSAGILQTPFGYLANRYNKVHLVVIGILFVSVIVPLTPICNSFWHFLILSIIGAVGTAIGNPAALALLVRGAKDIGFGLGFCLGVFNFTCGVGMVLGPVISGFIMDIFNLNQIFYVISALCLSAAIVINFYTKNYKEVPFDKTTLSN